MIDYLLIFMVMVACACYIVIIRYLNPEAENIALKAEEVVSPLVSPADEGGVGTGIGSYMKDHGGELACFYYYTI